MRNYFPQPLPINVTNKTARSCLASHPSQFKLMERTALSLPLLAASYHGQQAECNRCLRHHRRQSRNFRRLRTCTCACTCAPWVLQAEIGCGISSHLFYRVPGACTSAFCLLPRPTHGQHPVGRRRLQTLAGHAGFAHTSRLQLRWHALLILPPAFSPFRLFALRTATDRQAYTGLTDHGSFACYITA